MGRYYEEVKGLPCISVRSKGGNISRYYFHHWQEARDIQRILRIMQNLHGYKNVQFTLEHPDSNY